MYELIAFLLLGSTSASSAGTVCTAVLTDYDKYCGERKNSQTKLHRTNSSVSEYSLQRSCSTSTIGDNLEGAATIKRNGILLQKGVAALVHQAREELQTNQIENKTKIGTEFEYSESSDLECSDRLERMKTKTTINTSRIPSMCVITPGNSDDECGKKITETGQLLPKVVSIEFGSEIVSKNEKKELINTSKIKNVTMQPLDTFIERLKEVKPSLKDSPLSTAPIAEVEDLEDFGEYVTIKDKNSCTNTAKNHTGVYYSNDVVKRNLSTALSENINDMEYVCLNELPCNITNVDNKMETKQTLPARVVLNAHGQITYNSDSLKRRKAHTTFIPGPYIKQDTSIKQNTKNNYSNRNTLNENQIHLIAPANKEVHTGTDISASTMEGRLEFIDSSMPLNRHFKKLGQVLFDNHNKFISRDNSVVKRSDSYRRANYSSIDNLKRYHLIETKNPQPDKSNYKYDEICLTNINLSYKNKFKNLNQFVDAPLIDKSSIKLEPNSISIVSSNKKTDEGFAEESSCSDDSHESKSLMASIEQLLNQLSQNPERSLENNENQKRAERAVSQVDRNRTSFNFDFKNKDIKIQQNEFIDSDNEYYSKIEKCMPIQTKPTKIIVPSDSSSHKARIMKSHIFNNSTDIW